MKTFNIRTNNGLVEVQGKLVENPFGLKVFVHKKMEGKGYTISDYTTGLSITPANLFYADLKMKDVIQKWIETIERFPEAVKNYSKLIEKGIKDYGYANEH